MSRSWRAREDIEEEEEDFRRSRYGAGSERAPSRDRFEHVRTRGHHIFDRPIPPPADRESRFLGLEESARHREEEDRELLRMREENARRRRAAMGDRIDPYQPSSKRTVKQTKGNARVTFESSHNRVDPVEPVRASSPAVHETSRVRLNHMRSPSPRIGAPHHTYDRYDENTAGAKSRRLALRLERVEHNAQPFQLPTKYTSGGSLHGDDSEPSPQKLTKDPSQELKEHAYERLMITSGRWIGNDVERGEISLDLEIGTGSRTAAEIRWYHIQRPVMHFDEFTRIAETLPCRSLAEQRNLSKLLNDVRRKHEKQRQDGRELEASCNSDTFYADNKEHMQEQLAITFASYPFFQSLPITSKSTFQASAGTSGHPVRPLVHAAYHLASKERELEQVIARLGHEGPDVCLHIAQVWCVNINHDTLITCSTLPYKSLLPTTALIKTTPTAIGNEKSIETLVLTNGGRRRWQIPEKSSREWPVFFSNIASSFVTPANNPQVTLRDEQLNPHNWSDSLRAARKAFLPIRLVEADQSTAQREWEAKIAKLKNAVRAANPSRRARSRNASPGEEASTQSHAAEQKARDGLLQDIMQSKFNLFRSFAEWSAKGTDAVVAAILDDLQATLLAGSEELCRAYDSLGSSTAADVVDASALLLRLRIHRPDYVRAEIALSALRIGSLFVGQNVNHEMMFKLRNALVRLVRTDYSKETPKDLDRHYHPVVPLHYFDIERANDYLDEALNITTMLEAALQGYLGASTMPREHYLQAWLHFVAGMVLLSTNKDSFDLASLATNHLKATVRCLKMADETTIAKLRDIDIANQECCRGDGIAAIIIHRLAADVTLRDTDIDVAYADYLSRLKLQITEDVRQRIHQETLRHYIQEVDAILGVLQDQFSIGETFTEVGRSQDEDVADLPFLGADRQDIVLEETQARVSGRIETFRALRQQAETLGTWHLEQIDDKKDRQEAAIMVFTIVTIIFLPLSFVSGVFGMNVVDIRDTHYGQWIYWAVAIPLTLLVMLLSFWWAGELEPNNWFSVFARHGPRRAGFRRLRDARARPSAAVEGPYHAHVEAVDEYESFVPVPKLEKKTTYPFPSSAFR